MIRNLLFLYVILLSGCSFTQKISHSSPALITIKTPFIKISDTGFIRYNDKFLNLQIFSAAVAVFNLNLSDKACVDGLCYDTMSFNNKVLKYPHYKMILREILTRKPIYRGENLQKTQDGFVQNIIEKGKFNINYLVKENNMIFYDKLNKIKISIENLN